MISKKIVFFEELLNISCFFFNYTNVVYMYKELGLKFLNSKLYNYI